MSLSICALHRICPGPQSIPRDIRTQRKTAAFVVPFSPPFPTFSVPTIRKCGAAGGGDDRDELAEISGFRSRARSLLCKLETWLPTAPCGAAGTGLIFGATGLLAADRDDRDRADISRRPGGPARHAWSRAPGRASRRGGFRAVPLPERSHSEGAAKFGIQGRTRRFLFRPISVQDRVHGFPSASRIIAGGEKPALRVLIHIIDFKGLPFSCKRLSGSHCPPFRAALRAVTPALKKS